ncbi:serine-rich adhesin for platelets isoform X3 [Wyeomyia smithii]|uniref:serine-rich adhesin for platelets isoform X3 n=1 Tax=Wyeomyia smithii TaxID=174621 RepID=UPI002467DAB2|nr:serine-rich adhesin for platelets isoform X3 [Wyeomyia smithii]
MGKCASKQPVSGLNEFGSSPYLAICNEDDIIYINVGQSESKKSSKKAAAGLETKGTAMSFGFKKHKVHQSGAGGKLPGALGGTDGQTVIPGSVSGTGGSFKKVGATNGNHLYGGAGSEKEKATEKDNATVISNPGVEGIFSDKNGNMGSTDTIDDSSAKTNNGRSTPRLQPPKKDSYGAPYRNNRFGFRSTNVVRPASVGLQPKSIADYDKQHSSNNNNNTIHANKNNNNNNVYITDKRRSKSASSAATARTTFTPLQQAPAQIQQERASALPHPGIGALHKPLPKYQSLNQPTKITPSDACSAATNGAQQVMMKCDQAEHKNTSHHAPAACSGSSDDPRSHSTVNNANGRQFVSTVDTAQQHVATGSITKSAHTNGQETASVAKFTLHSSSLPKPQYPVPISLPSAAPRYDMDPKGAKQAVNISRKVTLQGGLPPYQVERSSDGMHDLNREPNPNVDTSSIIRMPRQRYRNLEMIMSGRHKFEVRDLETLTAEPIVPLALPKLPSAFNSYGLQQPIGMTGLVRSTELPRQLSDDIDINDNRYESEQHPSVDPLERKDSIASSDVESLEEEEKLTRDNNSSEKSLKGAILRDLQSEAHGGSKTSSPGSSRASWCNAGETMAPKECSSLSLSSSEGTNRQQRKPPIDQEDISSVTITAGNPSLMSSFSAAIPMDISINLDSISEVQNSFNDNTASDLPSSNQLFRTEETKFAEMAAAVDDAILLDDETSPTDSLVSSCTDSDDIRKHRKKPVEGRNDRDKEKDIDEISPELDELTSPVSPGTPTHASNSLSLSDGGRDFLIDDEIADQPALVFDEPAHNDSSMIDLVSLNMNAIDEAATLRDSVSSLNANNNKNSAKCAAPVPKPRKIMPDAYESPAPMRKNKTRLSRAESLDTLSPCDSIASDDFMLDFNSSMDSIDRAPRSIASESASALHSMDELQLWSELENKGGQLMHEWSKLLRSQRAGSSASSNNHNASRESITSQLPTRATRLLTRRLQNNATPTNCGTGGSESPRSMDSLPRRTALSASYKTATLNQFNNNFTNGGSTMSDSASTATNSAEDLTLLDKSLRNSMLQDVVHFKKQLVRLRRILQEDEENLMMTDTLNPFENNNGQFFTTALTAAATTATTTTAATTASVLEAAASLLEESGIATGTSSVDSKQQENLLIKESGVVALALLEDQRQELADLRRQGEITAKDRTIRQQQNLIEKYEAEREKLQAGLPNGSDGGSGDAVADKSIDTISTATQTERLRPLSFGGPEGLASSRSEPSTPSQPSAVRSGLRSSAFTASNSHHPHHQQHHHHQHHIPNGNSSSPANSTSTPSALISSSRTSLNLKPKTQISSVYTQLSSIKHSNHNGLLAGASNAALSTLSHKRASLGSSSNLSNIPTSNNSGTSSNNSNVSPTKTVRTTHIGNVLTSSKLNQHSLSGAGASTSTPPPLPTAANGTKLLKSSVRTQMNGKGVANSPSSLAPGVFSPKRSCAIKPPNSFGCNPFPETPIAHKSKSAPSTPMIERNSTSPALSGVQIIIDGVKENGYHGLQNGCSNGQHEDRQNEDDKEQAAETEKDAINNKIYSLKLANGLTGCNDSSNKESSLVI